VSGVAFILDLLFGAIGSGYLVYAKRQHSATFVIAGALLVIFPYFIDSVIGTLIIGAVIAAAPFAIERYAI
jgi:hypothetical protein